MVMNPLDDKNDNVQDPSSSLEDRFDEKHGVIDDYQTEEDSSLVLTDDTMAEDDYDVTAPGEAEELADDVIEDETTGDPLPDRYADEDVV